MMALFRYIRDSESIKTEQFSKQASSRDIGNRARKVSGTQGSNFVKSITRSSQKLFNHPLTEHVYLIKDISWFEPKT